MKVQFAILGEGYINYGIDQIEANTKGKDYI